MPDTLAVRAYRSDITNADANVRRTLASLFRFLGEVDYWLNTDASQPLPGIQNFGTDSAELAAAVARLKTLHDLSYLAD